MAGAEFQVGGPCRALAALIDSKKEEIGWADDISYILKRINDISATLGPVSDLPLYAKFLLRKVKEMEHCVFLDVCRHIAFQNGQSPYYVVRLAGLLDKTNTEVQNCLNDSGIEFEDSKKSKRGLSHMSAELQALSNEYGFCKTMEAILEKAEGAKKLDALIHKLDSLNSDRSNASKCIEVLYEVSSTSKGIREAITEHNYKQLEKQFGTIAFRLSAKESTFSSEHLKEDSQMIMQYLAQQHLIHQPFNDAIIGTDSFDIINIHMVHPGTRVWVLEAFERFLSNKNRRIFYLAGKQGTGKTAIASAICKLYNYDVIAYHFFDESQGDVFKNQMNGLVQSIASDMCRMIPEYVNYLDDHYNNNDITKDTETWQDSFEALLRRPLQELYGIGKTCNTSLKPRVVVIDGLDEMSQSEWREFKEFQRLITTQLAPAFKLFYTTRLKYFNEFIEVGDNVEGIRLEDRAIANRHIKDIEIYISSSIGAILSGEDEVETPLHAKSDEMTLQNTVDELLKCSAGRFDYAISLMESFATAFSSSGQFLSSVKRATQPVRQSASSSGEYEARISDFASPYRAYRDKEGRSVTVRVMRQSQYPMDKTRVALIRGRHNQPQSP